VFLALILCFGCLLAAVPPAHALVGIDDAAFLYTLWTAFGLKAGVDITTIGGDAFTRDAITGLYNEWQNSRVASGVQSAVSSLAEFVTNVLKVGTLVNPGSSAGGTLYTVLSLSETVTEKLAQFWNWVIVDKLGGTSVDAVDFDSSAGNLCFAGLPVVPLISAAPATASNGLFVGEYRGSRPYYTLYLGALSASSPVYTVYLGSAPYTVALISSGPFTYVQNDFSQRSGVLLDDSIGLYGATIYDSSAGYPVTEGYTNSAIPHYTNWNTLRAAFASGATTSGSLTVAPGEGIDVLGFPDTDELDYVPTDAVIPWSIPYDMTKDTNAYLEEAYIDALSNELTIGDQITDTPAIETVGPVGNYVVPGLGDVFPFCIPFDIYDFLSALAADPVAPHFEATLAFPAAIGGAQTIVLDFDSPTWNTLAQILRTMELLLFIVGLAFVTRSMIIRG